MLGTYSHFRSEDVLLGGWLHETEGHTLWDIYCEWLNSDRPSQLDRRLVTNYETFITARKNSREYTNACREAGAYALADSDVDTADENEEDPSDAYEVPSEALEITATDNGQTRGDRNFVLAMLPEYDNIQATPCTEYATTLLRPPRVNQSKFLSQCTKQENRYQTLESITPADTHPDHNAMDVGADDEGAAFVIPFDQLQAEAETNANTIWRRCIPAPSIEQACRLWNLDGEQSTALHLLAQKLLVPNDTTNSNTIIQGSPGTGKSTMVKALVWLAMQHDKLDEIAICAYTWQAAAEVSLPCKTATSTSYLFCISKDNKARTGEKAMSQLRERLGNVRIVIVDEYSFLDPKHVAVMHKQAQIAKRCEGSAIPFGGLTVAFTGDFQQLPGVGKTTLYHGADRENSRHMTELHPGRILWTDIQNVFVFKTNHRFPLGSPLQQLSTLFTDTALVNDTSVAALVQTLHNTHQATYQDAIAAGHAVQIIVPRNKQREKLNRECAQLIAKRDHKQLLVWQNPDEVVPYELTDEEWQYLREQPPERCKYIPTVGMFMPGMDYLVTDSKAPLIGRKKNALAQGVAIYLDAHEPPNQATAHDPVRILQYPPAAIVVKPRGAIEHLQIHEAPVPPGCLIFTKQTETFTLAGVRAGTIDIKRTGIPISPAYAISDYCAQGQTYGRNKMYFTDFEIPQNGSLKRESGYVTLTRHRQMEQVNALTPLIPQGKQPKDAPCFGTYLDKLRQPNPAKEAELRRLEQLRQSTEQRHAPLFALYRADH
jgi:adenylate kinase